MKIWAGAVVAVIVAVSQRRHLPNRAIPPAASASSTSNAGPATPGEGGAQTAGPNLHGVFGRKAGTAEGYEFSEAMIKSGIVWDDTTMADYNRDPKAKVPGTKMVFNGVKQAGQLADLVAYLKQATQ